MNHIVPAYTVCFGELRTNQIYMNSIVTSFVLHANIHSKNFYIEVLVYKDKHQQQQQQHVTTCHTIPTRWAIFMQCWFTHTHTHSKFINSANVKLNGKLNVTNFRVDYVDFRWCLVTHRFVYSNRLAIHFGYLYISIWMIYLFFVFVGEKNHAKFNALIYLMLLIHDIKLRII